MYQDINIHVNCTHLPPSYSRKDEILKEIGEKIFSKKKKTHQMYKSHATLLRSQVIQLWEEGASG